MQINLLKIIKKYLAKYLQKCKIYAKIMSSNIAKEQIYMPIIKSAKKRQEVAIRNNARNKSERSALATAIKKFNKAIADKDVQLAEKLLPETFSIIDEEVTKGIIHKNKANNKKASLSIELTKLKAE